MRFIRYCALPLVLSALCGCIPLFLHAGYTAKDVVVDSRLVGTWIETNASASPFGPDSISCQLEEGKGYRITYFERGSDPDSLVFLGHLFRVGAMTLIDLEPHPSDVVSALYVPAHSFWRVAFLGDTLVRGWLEEDWAVAAAHRGAPTCTADTIGAGGWSPDVVFTCGAPAVRRLLAQAAEDPGAFRTDSLISVGTNTQR